MNSSVHKYFISLIMKYFETFNSPTSFLYPNNTFNEFLTVGKRVIILYSAYNYVKNYENYFLYIYPHSTDSFNSTLKELKKLYLFFIYKINFNFLNFFFFLI